MLTQIAGDGVFRDVPSLSLPPRYGLEKWREQSTQTHSSHLSSWPFVFFDVGAFRGLECLCAPEESLEVQRCEAVDQNRSRMPRRTHLFHTHFNCLFVSSQACKTVFFCFFFLSGNTSSDIIRISFSRPDKECFISPDPVLLRLFISCPHTKDSFFLLSHTDFSVGMRNN